jgi:hypothetical protein
VAEGQGRRDDARRLTRQRGRIALPREAGIFAAIVSPCGIVGAVPLPEIPLGEARVFLLARFRSRGAPAGGIFVAIGKKFVRYEPQPAS